MLIKVLFVSAFIGPAALLHHCWLTTGSWLPTYDRIVPWLHPWLVTWVVVLYREAKLPERWFPGTFDIFGASHQVFHCLSMIPPYLLITAYASRAATGMYLCSHV
jgi:hypothetical protein